MAVGPLVGGVLTEKLGWEYIFFVNVPIGIGAIFMTLAKVEESRSPAEGRVDWAGLVTFSGGLLCLVYALIRGNAEGWTSTQIVGLLAAALVLLVAFVVVERRQRLPMLDLSLFRNPAFDGASIAAFVLSASMFAMFLYLTLYIQNALGYSALEAGLRFLPVTLLSFLVAPLSGKLSERFGVRWFIAGGLALVGLGLLLMRGVQPGDDWTALLAGFIVAGGGIGLVNPALATAAVGVVEPQRSGMASGINSTFRQVGIATGTAALGAIFAHVVNGREEAFAQRGASPAPPRFAPWRRASSPTSSRSAASAGCPAASRWCWPDATRSCTGCTPSCSTRASSPSRAPSCAPLLIRAEYFARPAAGRLTDARPAKRLDAVTAAVNLFDATVRGGLADTRRMPSALIDEGPLRRVHRYLPLGRGGRRSASLPVLLVPPLAAPAICFDLRRGCSLAEHLLRRGHETYLVDYGPVRFGDRSLGLEHWIEDVLPNAVRAVVGGRRRAPGAARRLVPRRDPRAARAVRRTRAAGRLDRDGREPVRLLARAAGRAAAPGRGR